MEASMSTRNAKESTLSRVSVLESQVDNITSNVTKLEQKVDSSYAVLHHRISELRDDFRLELDNKHEKLIQKLDEQTASSTAQHKVIHDQIEELNRWKWMLVGGATVTAAVLGYVFALVDFSVLLQ